MVFSGSNACLLKKAVVHCQIWYWRYGWFFRSIFRVDQSLQLHGVAYQYQYREKTFNQILSRICQIAVILSALGRYSLVRYSETRFYLAHSYTVAREEASVFLRKTRLQGGKLRPLSAYYKFKPKRRFKGITSQNVSDNINIRGGK